MAIRITPRDSEAAQELAAFIMAYPAIEIAPGFYYVFDPTDAQQYQDMEHNTATIEATTPEAIAAIMKGA